MILADKIIALRNRSGWSQEELAEQLGVTRQSVSKWEGAQSVPDMDKIVRMSRLFGVTTDYLLKDELEETGAPTDGVDSPLRRVTMAEASDYLALSRARAPWVALGVSLCVLSPVTLIFLSAVSELSSFGISEERSAGIGLCVLIVLVAVAVALFLSHGAKQYEFIENDPFEREYGVEGMVRERQAAQRRVYDRLNLAGTMLCILSVLPLFACVCVSASDFLYTLAVCVLLTMVAAGCFCFVYGGVYHSATQALLEEGDYSRANKALNPTLSAVSGIYWLVVVAIFLFYTFGPSGNGHPQYSWFIWAVAGVLFGAVTLAVKLWQRRNG